MILFHSYMLVCVACQQGLPTVPLSPNALPILPTDSPSPAAAFIQIFADMDKNADQSLSFDEFVEGSKKDPSIIQALSLYDGLVRRLARRLLGGCSADDGLLVLTGLIRPVVYSLDSFFCPSFLASEYQYGFNGTTSKSTSGAG